MNTGEMRVNRLGTTELFVVSALRLWALPHCDPGRHYPDWRVPFHSVGLGELGASSFAALCRILASSVAAGLSIHPLRCGQLGEDEAQLLHTLWLLQQRQLSYAHTHLRSWCCANAAPLAIGPASTFALLLQTQHMRISFHYAEDRAIALHGVRGPHVTH
jgi:hypothetical protein